ncbi:MAG: hypothetical protein HQL95_14870 [Magnetococcales bacterium]|nr:hypothetical protein [Magnetococcales bacterium]
MLLSAQGGTRQLEINLIKVPMAYIDLLKTWYVKQAGFDQSGRYEVFYYSIEDKTGDISPVKRSIVYKQKAGNTGPNTFSLLSPANGSTSTKTVSIFTWDPAVDPNGDAVTYNLLIAKDSAFQNMVYRQEGITVPSAFLVPAGFVDGATSLEDQITYYWKVEAVDAYGAHIDSKESWHFTTNNTNSIPGIVYGIVLSDLDASRIASAVVTLNGNPVQSMADGSLMLLADAGTTTLSGSKSGFQDASLPAVTVQSEESTRVTLTLHSLAGDYHAPTITGTPGSSVTAGKAYNFTPTVTGSNLLFSIVNKPAWAAFDTKSGQLTGTPTTVDVGTTGSIVIGVTDGVTPVFLTAFDLAVSTSDTTAPSAKLDVDGNSKVDATDGVLILRRLSGASTIDTGVVLPSGQNNDSVISAINALGAALDIDGSGKVDATDGVLILRRLSGASTIDTGVVLPSGQNNDSVIGAIDGLSGKGQ